MNIVPFFYYGPPANTNSQKGTCTVKEYLTDNKNIRCFGCDNCHYGWHISINDKPYTYCPNCGTKIVYERL